MKINKNVIKDAVDILKEFESDSEKQLRITKAMFPENDNYVKNEVEKIIEERLRKIKTSIAQLSLVLYSK